MKRERSKQKGYYFFILIWLCFVLFSFDECFSTDYFVSIDGNDDNSGLSTESSWKTIHKINSFKFEDGDTVHFNRGDIFDDATLMSPDVDNFTFCDYGSGDLPIIGNNKYKPIFIAPREKINNLLLKNLDISGQGYSSVKETSCSIMNVHGLTLDGIKADGYFENNFSGKNALFIGGTVNYSSSSGEIKIINCRINNYGPENMPQVGTDFIGIVIGNVTDGSIVIHDNVLHDFNADGIQIFKSRVPVSIYSNFFYNFGENAIDVKSSSEIFIFNNKFTNKNSFSGSGGSGGGSTIGVHDPYGVGDVGRVEIYNNEFYATYKTTIGLSKVKDIQIYNNIFDKITGRPITVSNSESIDINKNYFSRTSGCVNIKTGSRNVTINNNIFYNYHKWSDKSGVEFGCVYENNDSTEVTAVHNNTFFNRSGDGRVSVNIDCSQGSKIYDNTFYQEDHGDAADAIKVGVAPAEPVQFYGNCLCTPDAEARLQRFTPKLLIQSSSLATSSENYVSPTDATLFGMSEIDRTLPPRLSISPDKSGRAADPMHPSRIPLEAFRAKNDSPCRQKGVIQWGANGSP